MSASSWDHAYDSSSYHDSLASLGSIVDDDDDGSNSNTNNNNGSGSSLKTYKRPTKPFRSMADKVSMGYQSTKQSKPSTTGWTKVRATPLGLTPQKKEKIVKGMK